ncbi:hypothetical protein GF413_00465 [Candidatus Micrarchaeota archaeon]|nr:hypothetical protein [Candidatus Micrarchaeota archaeon]
MIVLDEQLLGRNVEIEIDRWHKGSVVFINELRPNMVIKDEYVPLILREQKLPTFVTINVLDFWRKTPIDKRYCIVCLQAKDRDVPKIPDLLRALLSHNNFAAKKKRAGLIIRVTLGGRVKYYGKDDEKDRELNL